MLDIKPTTRILKDAAIQRFEYTFELAWKTLKRYLETNAAFRETHLKEIFREAGRQELLDDVERWFAYLEARNLTSHTYNRATADKVFRQVKLFARDVDRLILELQRRLD